MSAADHLGPQFHFTFDGGQGSMPKVYAHHGNDVVGKMRWNAIDGEIDNIHVDHDYRRQGIATGMWTAGQAFADLHAVANPQHSPHRTVAGDAWARSVSPKSLSD